MTFSAARLRVVEASYFLPLRGPRAPYSGKKMPGGGGGGGGGGDFGVLAIIISLTPGWTTTAPGPGRALRTPTESNESAG